MAVLAEFSFAIMDGLDLWVWPGVQKISSELPTVTHFIWENSGNEVCSSVAWQEGMRHRDGSFLGYLSDPLTLGTSVSIRARIE